MRTLPLIVFLIGITACNNRSNETVDIQNTARYNEAIELYHRVKALCLVDDITKENKNEEKSSLLIAQCDELLLPTPTSDKEEITKYLSNINILRKTLMKEMQK